MREKIAYWILETQKISWTKNKNVILLSNLMILWDLTRWLYCARIWQWCDYSFLPPYSPFCASQKCFQEEASTFPLLLCQISFPAHSLFWWWHITMFILMMLLVGGWLQLLQGEQRQQGCEYSNPRPQAPGWAGTVVLWQQSIWALLLLVVGLSTDCSWVPLAPVARDVSVSIQLFLPTW